MNIYILIWFFIVAINFISNYKTYINKIFFLLFFLFLFVFIGLRFKVGGDWDNYLVLYENFKYLNFKEALFFFEPGYSLFNILGNFLQIRDIWFVNLCSSALVCIFLFITFIKLEKYWLCLLIYYPYHILAVSLGYTRQSIAVAILLYAFLKLLQNNKIKFLIFLLIAVCFHKTAIIFILFYPLLFIKGKKVLIILYEIFSLILITLILYISSLNESTVYTSEELNSSGVFLRLSLHIIPVISYFLLRNKVFKLDKSYLFLDYFVLLIFYCFCLSFLFSTLADRFNLYLIFFDIYVLVAFYHNLLIINRKILIFILTLFFTSFIYIWMLNSVLVAIAWLPYQNYLIDYLLTYVF
ncbi:EpsG family protein [Acinetobacter baumannii]|uniref:EpsG family protein n=1 Tax=Acinetobacter baumannii TaxID=470 RepID=UPI00201CD36B|nr:EpsG family protein [Acinetobacter baumannii]MCL6695760.1 EpsG family protein [Acinetobacter baumannii]MDC4346090.1 EpsG family protein [Acinetobacter baumannii]WBG54409.1 Wzy [Acinetobacter baumannii]